MKITKQRLMRDINQSRSFYAIRLSSDEIRQEKDKQVKSLKSDIDNALRTNKDITIVIIH
jgi:hypothetical protein